MLDTPQPLPPDPDTALAPPPHPDAQPATRTLDLRFTGSGAEYFRIWIVNLALSVLTLGIYSAWAKVRRLRYFDRNTELDGAVFDFDGDPKAILRGRILALVLVGAYQYAFGFSLAVGIAVVIALIVSLPFLMRGALHFRLGNTRYRGLRFHFTGSVKGSYAAYLPAMVLFLSPAALAAVEPEAVVLVPLFYLLWPPMHGAMKRYQHGNITYASLASTIDLRASQFYGPYLRMLGLGAASFVVAFIIGVLIGIAGFLIARTMIEIDKSTGPLLAVALGALVFYLMYLMSGPYLQVRLGNMVWSATSFPGVRIESTMKARAFARLQTVNTLLTLVTLGLYRPFAVVKVYQYRLAHLSVTVDDSFDAALCATQASTGSASADGVADFLGVDLSW